MIVVLVNFISIESDKAMSVDDPVSVTAKENQYVSDEEVNLG